MREILFRGKHIHLFPQNKHLNGTWVYGYLCDKNYINSPELNGELLVDQSTVGQYTGLKDNNGKRIFEGDIVRCGTGRICKVTFFISPGVSGFDLVPIDGFDAPPPHNWSLFSDTEVIGNIHDNP